MVANQLNSTGLMNTQYHCDYTRAHAGHVVTCSRHFVSCLSTIEVQGCLFHTQRVFIVEHCLASRPYLTCQNEFRDTFLDSPVPDKSTISRLVNRFRDTGSVQDRNRSGRTSALSDDSLDDIRQTLFRYGHSRQLI
jgi:hypothetical protein